MRMHMKKLTRDRVYYVRYPEGAAGACGPPSRLRAYRAVTLVPGGPKKPGLAGGRGMCVPGKGKSPELSGSIMSKTCWGASVGPPRALSVSQSQPYGMPMVTVQQRGRAVGAGGVPVHHHFGHFDGPKCSAARARRSPPKSLPRQALLPSIAYGTDPVVINIGGLKADLNSAACTRALGLEPRVITSFSPVPLKASHLEACKRNSVRHHRGSIAVSEEH